MKEEQKHNKDLGFQVPQDFFENFEEQMMTQLNLEEKIGKETGFQVPDGYFESLEKQLLPVKETKVKQLNSGLNLKKSLYPLLAAAAVIAVVLSINTGAGESIKIANVETTELEEYLLTDASLYDDTTVDLLFTNNNILDDFSVTDGYETEEIYDYLQEEVEYNEIITE